MRRFRDSLVVRSTMSADTAYLRTLRRRHQCDAASPSPRARKVPSAARFGDRVSGAAYALALRVLMVAVAALVDAWKPGGLRYTDVDYDVLRDGAAAVLRGGSPFERATYRYSPFVSWLLLLDLWTSLPLAKLLFCVCDVWLGQSVGALARERGASPAVAALWLWNPISIILCTRGSWDALTVWLVLLALRSKRAPVRAGALLGVATHLRLYPVTYSVAFLGHFFFEKRRLAFGPSMKFGVAFAGGVLAPTLYAHRTYGMVYVEEALAYHLTREDHRHSFSVFWLPIYLAQAVQNHHLRRLLKLAPFLAHLALQTAALLTLRRDLDACVFAQTLLFVAANKVCTAQYFCWWLPLLIVVAADKPLNIIRPARNWVVCCGLWLSVAYALEFRGLAAHALLWGCSLLFFRANVDLLLAAVASPSSEKKEAPRVLVTLSNGLVETESWTDDGDTDDFADDSSDPGTATGWGVAL